MDKGFNDDELADIMNEIENLEQEFVDDAQIPKDDGPAEITEEDLKEAQALDDEIDGSDLEQEESVAQEEVAQEEVAQEPVAQEEVAEEEVAEEVVAQEEVSEEVVAQQEEVAEEVLAASEDNMDEVLEELSDMPVEKVVPLERSFAAEDHHSKGATSGGAQTALNFSVSGQMNLKMNFEVNGECVSLFVDAQQGLVLEMQGGAKFTLPVGVASQNKAS